MSSPQEDTEPQIGDHGVDPPLAEAMALEAEDLIPSSSEEERSEAVPYSAKQTHVDTHRVNHRALLGLALPAVALSGALWWLIKKYQKRRSHRQRPPQPQEPPSTLPILVAECRLDPPEGLEGTPLQGTSFVVSEDIDVAGCPTTHGVYAPAEEVSAPLESSPLVTRLVASGATLLAKSSVQELASLNIGDNLRNPSAKFYTSGGGCTGAPVAVAAGLVDFAVAVEVGANVRVPSACTGMTLFSGTSGSSPSSCSAGLPPYLTPGDHESVAVVARDVAPLLKVGRALGQPGSSNLRGEIVRVVVSEDLFALCGSVMQPALLAVKRAILKWAGSDQAGSVNLTRFLDMNLKDWRKQADKFPEEAKEQEQGEAEAGETGAEGSSTAEGVEPSSSPLLFGEGPIPPVLEALWRASRLLVDYQCVLRHRAALGSTPESDLSSEVLQSLRRGSALSQDQLSSARALRDSLHSVMRSTIKSDTVVALPVLPGPPLPLGASTKDQKKFLMLAEMFGCIPGLASCPSMVIPAGQLPDGAPLCIALLSPYRSDMKLLAVAEKMAPLIQQMFASIVLEGGGSPAPNLKQQGTVSSRNASGGPHGGVGLKGKLGPGAKKGTKGRGKGPVQEMDPKRLEKAEKLKEAGNVHFKAGRYAEAIKEYSKAISLHPDNPTYYNNRAMACLKIFRFEQAELDCSKALSYDLQEVDKCKALLRRGNARMGLHRLEEGAKDFKLVLALQPNNRQAKEDLEALEEMMEEMQNAAQQAQYEQMMAGPHEEGGEMAGGVSGEGPMDPRLMQMMQGMMPPGVDPSMMMDPEQLAQLYQKGVQAYTSGKGEDGVNGHTYGYYE